MLVSWWINLIGTIFSLTGTIFAFFGTPRDTIGIETGATVVDLQLRGKADEMFKNYMKRYKFSRIGLGLLVIGFFLILVAQLFVYPS